MSPGMCRRDWLCWWYWWTRVRQLSPLWQPSPLCLGKCGKTPPVAHYKSLTGSPHAAAFLSGLERLPHSSERRAAFLCVLPCWMCQTAQQAFLQWLQAVGRSFSFLELLLQDGAECCCGARGVQEAPGGDTAPEHASKASHTRILGLFFAGCVCKEPSVLALPKPLLCSPDDLPRKTTVVEQAIN